MHKLSDAGLLDVCVVFLEDPGMMQICAGSKMDAGASSALCPAVCAHHPHWQRPLRCMSVYVCFLAISG
jgi:hypothetical protein